MTKKDSLLGRALIKAHKRSRKFVAAEGFRHTRDLDEGRGSEGSKLRSITEQTSLEDFLSKAVLAASDFVAEKCNVKIVPVKTELLSEEKAILSAQERDEICIPRRPHWNLEEMSKEEIDLNEREAFLLWRRKLAFVQETENITLTPFEKNFEVWRQLWRVIERSDVIVQIIDARNPLLFCCADLEAYVKEVDEKKVNILLLNKADFLTESERKNWCNYFETINVQIVFFSALIEGQKPIEENEESSEEMPDIDTAIIKNSPDVLSRKNLIRFLKSLCKHTKTQQHTPTAGLVGYPNVGKSSTLNTLLMSKRVSVSATPGKTKHFQTLLLDEDLLLCDSPGLVFPNLVSSKAEMIINGILPIDRLTEFMQATTLITNMIPRRVLEQTYSLLISTPGEGRDSSSTPTAEEFLNAHGYNRGFMTKRGLPDIARSARCILKDFVKGKLLYCHAPPNVSQEYPQFPEIKKKTAHKLQSQDDKQTEMHFLALNV